MTQPKLEVHLIADVPLSGKYANGRSAYVDAEDSQFVSRYSWSIDQTGYPHARVDGRTQRLHRCIIQQMGLQVPKGMVVDHIDRNPLNNTRQNLRITNHTQNIFNSGPNRANTSGVKGVTWNKRSGKWVVQLRIHGKYQYHGHFLDLEAAKAKSVEVRTALGIL